MVSVKCIPVGQMEANCYIAVEDTTGDALVIDPGDESNTILDYLEETGVKLHGILLTHGHYDHTGAAETIAQEKGVKLWICAADQTDDPDDSYRFCPHIQVQNYVDGDIIHAGDLLVGVLQTPGHSPGSVCFMTDGVLFTGDTLFKGSCGRTDLPGGDIDALSRSLRRLYKLPGDYEIYPGHMDPSTLDFERRFNPYMRAAAGVD